LEPWGFRRCTIPTPLPASLFSPPYVSSAPQNADWQTDRCHIDEREQQQMPQKIGQQKQ
jgi:hypothetical protein